MEWHLQSFASVLENLMLPVLTSFPYHSPAIREREMQLNVELEVKRKVNTMKRCKPLMVMFVLLLKNRC